MNQSLKVQPHHLERGAYLYVRQSSMKQVVENIESAKRQYGLRTRALALGWRDDQVTVIDTDQGESGASASWREGFQHLVTEVSMGRAGIVMGLEVSRLARNSADWHRLLEISALAETLILDEDGVYDPANFNDRLLLGLKGTMSEAELHVLKARLRGGIISKARRGEYRCQLPTGLVYDEAGQVVLDPDLQVRDTIAHFFETFARVGSAHQTVKVFRQEELLFPSRGRRRDEARIVFRPLTSSTAIRMLHNPRYAGAYAYGRRRYRRTPSGKKVQTNRKVSEWIACIPDAHPGYISWDQHQDNLRILQANGGGYELARSSPPREGIALLQGRAVCGRCGRFLRTRYRARRGRPESWYVCDRGASGLGEPNCQSVAGGPVDQVVGALVAELMTPAAVELAIRVQDEVEARHEEVEQLRNKVVQRAEAEADLAQRRYMMVDPHNRLVADSLEAEWNEKLRALTHAREDRDRQLREDRLSLDDTVRKRLMMMASDLRALWDDPATSPRERKRMLAYVIEDVTLVKVPEDGVTRVHVRFRGGRRETLTAQNPKSSAEQVRTSSEIVALVDRLLDDHVYDEIADVLNGRGLRPGGSARKGCAAARFTSKRVAYLVHRYDLKPRRQRLRERGMLTRREVAERLGVHSTTVSTWTKHGILIRHACSGNRWLYEAPGENLPVKHCSRWDTLAKRALAMSGNGPRKTRSSAASTGGAV